MAKTDAVHLRDLKIDRLLKEIERLVAENKRLRTILEDTRQALGMQIDDDDILAEIKYLQEINTTPPG